MQIMVNSWRRFACCPIQMREYEQVAEMDGERCVGTQTSPVSSEDDEQCYSDPMDKYYGDKDLNAIEYEEVILKRPSTVPRLGLTLCYGAADDKDTDIFISEIEEGSIAHRDGRLRAGDQILQVNGEPIHSRMDAIQQFRSNRSEISILLARSVQIEEEEEEMTEDKCGGVEDEKETYTDANSSNSTFEKDSGLSRTTDSDTELLPPPICSRSQSPDLPQSVNADESKLRRCASDISLEHELASLHREMETIRLECDRLISKHNSAERRMANQVAQASLLLPTNNPFWQSPQARLFKIEETSSAYNTGGESSRSTPLKNESQRQINASNQTSENSSKEVPEGIYYKVERLPKYQRVEPVEEVLPSHSRVKFRLPQYSVVVRESNQQKIKKNQNTTDKCDVLNGKRYLPGTTMYTSPDKLAETIALQQRLLREAMMEQAQMLRPHGGAQRKKSNESYEWKVKRRSDGTRYITRRPVRNRLLREREEQLNRERVSTDDDAMSELKTGRFWNREERKKHLEKAKERRVRHLQLLAEKNRRPADQMIIQLSHDKMMRRKGKLLFDKFTTIQEFLVHGNRNPSNQTFDGILSVTTV